MTSVKSSCQVSIPHDKCQKLMSGVNTSRQVSKAPAKCQIHAKCQRVLGGSLGRLSPSIKGGCPSPFGHIILEKIPAEIRLSYTLYQSIVI